MGGSRSGLGFGDSQDPSVCDYLGKCPERKAKDDYRGTVSSSSKPSPPILIPVNCRGRPGSAVTDQIRALAKERLRSKLGVITSEELAALEEALTQIMQLR